MEIKPTEYTLQTVATGRNYPDSGWLLGDKECSSPSLIRAVYAKKQIEFKDNSFGLYKFADWLPVQRALEGSCAPVTYKSEGLAKELGLTNLYITFSGYWPEKGATMYTCSFKETEAYSVCARLPKDEKKILVVASAGNTARAFAQVCSDNNIPIVIAVPCENMGALWFKKPLNKCVKIICTPAGTDYFDAIQLGAKVCESPAFLEEGGAKNVARRDGMGTTVLSAVEHIGRIPDSYFQAIGSGTGTIAVWEANMRFVEDGRFGNHLMKLIPSQNIPFTPMYDAWKQDSRALLQYDEEDAVKRALKIDAKVLSNRRPPYSLAGGLYDALKATDGTILMADNLQAAKAAELFEQTEGIDIHPAPAIALATLISQVESGNIDPKAVVMLNITGGGEKRAKEGKQLWHLKPSIVFDLDLNEGDVIEKVESLFK